MEVVNRHRIAYGARYDGKWGGRFAVLKQSLRNHIQWFSISIVPIPWTSSGWARAKLPKGAKGKCVFITKKRPIFSPAIQRVCAGPTHPPLLWTCRFQKLGTSSSSTYPKETFGGNSHNKKFQIIIKSTQLALNWITIFTHCIKYRVYEFDDFVVGARADEDEARPGICDGSAVQRQPHGRPANAPGTTAKETVNQWRMSNFL